MPWKREGSNPITHILKTKAGTGRIQHRPGGDTYYLVEDSGGHRKKSGHAAITVAEMKKVVQTFLLEIAADSGRSLFAYNSAQAISRAEAKKGLGCSCPTAQTRSIGSFHYNKTAFGWVVARREKVLASGFKTKVEAEAWVRSREGRDRG